MNIVMVNGYVLKNRKYKKNQELNRMELGFSIAITDYVNCEIVNMPVLAIGKMATEIYSKLCDDCYVEIVGYISKTKQGKIYILVKDIVIKEPKSKTQYYYSSKEFMEIFKPSNIIKELISKDKDESKKDN